MDSAQQERQLVEKLADLWNADDLCSAEKEIRASLLINPAQSNEQIAEEQGCSLNWVKSIRGSITGVRSYDY